MKEPRDMGGEELRREQGLADRRLGLELDRLRLEDTRFRVALDRCLTLDAEALRRKNT